MAIITDFDQFISESYTHSRSFDDEDMSPAAQVARREREDREKRNTAARNASNNFYSNKPKPNQKKTAEEPVRYTTLQSASDIRKSSHLGMAFAELLPPVKMALEMLTPAERERGTLGTSAFKEGMDMYYVRLNGPNCKEIDKAQYHRDAKECRDLEDLYVLISMYIEEYFENTNGEEEKSVFVPRKRKDPESEGERTERKRQSWY